MLHFPNKLEICISIVAMIGLSACHEEPEQNNSLEGIACGDVFCDPDTQTCKDGACVDKGTTPEPEKPECTTDTDCNDENKECKNQKCVDKVPEEPEACPTGQERCDDECV